MIYIIIIVVVLVLIVLWVLSSYNSFIKLDNQVKEAFSTMDVYLKKRWDLIPNLVETVKGYAKHEKGTLEEVIKLRNSAYDGMSDEEKIQTNAKISAAIPKIMALAESYPDLKANENFMNLSNQIASLEEDIANSRKYYNGTVKIYNNKVQMIPSNIIASMFGFKAKEMFEIAQEERQNVKVEF